VLREDPFFAVRGEAARALRSIHTDEAFAALVEGLDQPDARARQRVMSAVAGFYRSDAYDTLLQRLNKEKNPDILSAEIRGLGTYPRFEVRQKLINFLDTPSYRNALADAAIAAMRAQGDPAYLEPLRKNLAHHEADFTSSGFGRGLETLGSLAKNEDKKDDVREFLLRFVNHRKRNVQVAAINALGTLGDPLALPALETFATANKESPERQAADKAVAALRAAKKPADEFRDLRSEVLDLKKDNRELKKQLDDLKKKIEATETKSPEKPRKKAVAKGAV
jgi:HEAT repeat protein